jgi:hypothetical protein
MLAAVNENDNRELLSAPGLSKICINPETISAFEADFFPEVYVVGFADCIRKSFVSRFVITCVGRLFDFRQIGLESFYILPVLLHLLREEFEFSRQEICVRVFAALKTRNQALEFTPSAGARTGAPLLGGRLARKQQKKGAEKNHKGDVGPSFHSVVSPFLWS